MSIRRGRPLIYDEPKQRLEVSVTDTAIKWLQKQMIELDSKSLSDTLEKLARIN